MSQSVVIRLSLRFVATFSPCVSVLARVRVRSPPGASGLHIESQESHNNVVP